MLGNSFVHLGSYIFLFGISFIFLFPFLFMAVTSLKTNADLLDATVGWIPRSIKLKNYIMAMDAMQYPKYFLNSLILTVSATVGHVVSCSFIGYGLARYQFAGKRLLMFFVILSIIIPIQTIIIPLYVVYSNLNWLDSYLPIIIPSFFGFGLKGGLFIFIARQFLLSIPKEMEEAARIDGCGFLKIFFRIVMPIVKPMFLVMIVLSFVWHWNDFYEPSIYFGKPEILPLPSMLKNLISFANRPIEEILKTGSYMESEELYNSATIMAGCAITIAPLLVMFAFVQKKFVQSVERTGLVE